MEGVFRYYDLFGALSSALMPTEAVLPAVVAPKHPTFVTEGLLLAVAPVLEAKSIKRVSTQLERHFAQIQTALMAAPIPESSSTSLEVPDLQDNEGVVRALGLHEAAHLTTTMRDLVKVVRTYAQAVNGGPERPVKRSAVQALCCSPDFIYGNSPFPLVLIESSLQQRKGYAAAVSLMVGGAIEAWMVKTLIDEFEKGVQEHAWVLTSCGYRTEVTLPRPAADLDALFAESHAAAEAIDKRFFAEAVA